MKLLFAVVVSASVTVIACGGVAWMLFGDEIAQRLMDRSDRPAAFQHPGPVSQADRANGRVRLTVPSDGSGDWRRAPHRTADGED